MERFCKPTEDSFSIDIGFMHTLASHRNLLQNRIYIYICFFFVFSFLDFFFCGRKPGRVYGQWLWHILTVSEQAKSKGECSI